MKKSGEEIREAARKAATMPDATVEICGLWVWVGFPSKPSSPVRLALKNAGFKFGKRKGKWYFAGCSSYNKKPATMEYIRSKYGSMHVDDAEAA